VAAGDEKPEPAPILNTVRMHRIGCPAFRLHHLARAPTAVSRAAPERQQIRCCQSMSAVHHPLALACAPHAELALADKGSAPVRDFPTSFVPDFPLVAPEAAAGMADTAAERCIAPVRCIVPENCTGPEDHIGLEYCAALEDCIALDRCMGSAGIAAEGTAAVGIAAARIAADCTGVAGIADAPAVGRRAGAEPEPEVAAASLCRRKDPAEAGQPVAADKQEPGLARAVRSHRQRQAAVLRPVFWEASNEDNRRTQEEPHHHISDIST